MITNTIQLWNEHDDAKLTTYILDDSKEFQQGKRRPAVIVCPGGAYLGTSDREAEPVALRFAAAGYHAFVLRYTTYYKGWRYDFSQPGNERSQFPQPLFDLAKAVLTVRENAEAWNVDPDRIVVCGFSAGGHLAASLGVHWQEAFLKDRLEVENDRLKPNALLLCYGVLDYVLMKEEGEREPNEGAMALWKAANRAVFGKELPTDEELEARSPSRHVSALTPPTFLWHTAEDGLVYASNSLVFALALARHKVPYELHVFESGGHGLSLCDETTANEPGHVNPDAAVWVELALTWLGNRVLDFS